MASSTMLISLLFFLVLLSSLPAHARESKFFSKATAAAANGNESTAAEVIPNKEQEPLSKQGQEPSFIPDTQNGYGLYGHEPEQLPPTTTVAATTTTPTTNNNNNENYYYNNGGSNYNTQRQGMSDTRFLENGKYFYDINGEKNYNPNGFQKSRGVVDYSNNNFFHNGGANGFNTQQQGSADTELLGGGYTGTGADAATNRYYNTQKQGMSDTRFLENGKYYYDINGEKSRAVDEYNKNNNYHYHNGANGYHSQRQQEDFTNSDIYNSGGSYYGEPQGMSDTRFMENGKYYYDANGENSRGVEHFNRKDYYGNNGNTYGYSNSMEGYNRKGHYGNNGNTYEYSNSMEGYQNQQEQFQEGEEEEEYVP